MLFKCLLFYESHFSPHRQFTLSPVLIYLWSNYRSCTHFSRIMRSPRTKIYSKRRNSRSFNKSLKRSRRSFKLRRKDSLLRDESRKLVGVSIDGLKAMLDVLLTKSLATLEMNPFYNAEVPLHRLPTHINVDKLISFFSLQ